MLPTIRHSKLNSSPPHTHTRTHTQAVAAAWSPQTLTSLCRSVHWGRRIKRTSPGHKRPSLLSSRSALPELTSEVLLPYKWDKVLSNCWLKLKPNSHMRWRLFDYMWKEIVMSYSRLTWVCWINAFLSDEEDYTFFICTVAGRNLLHRSIMAGYLLKFMHIAITFLNKKKIRFNSPDTITFRNMHKRANQNINISKLPYLGSR